MESVTQLYLGGLQNLKQTIEKASAIIRLLPHCGRAFSSPGSRGAQRATFIGGVHGERPGRRAVAGLASG
jgi:hypothetical protein